VGVGGVVGGAGAGPGGVGAGGGGEGAGGVTGSETVGGAAPGEACSPPQPASIASIDACKKYP